MCRSKAPCCSRIDFYGVETGLERIAVIDFETTGISPSSSCRATEIAVVILEQGRIVERYQSLMNAGVRVPAFIEQLTGISNAMLRTAPSAEQVMN